MYVMERQARWRSKMFWVLRGDYKSRGQIWRDWKMSGVGCMI